MGPISRSQQKKVENSKGENLRLETFCVADVQNLKMFSKSLLDDVSTSGNLRSTKQIPSGLLSFFSKHPFGAKKGEWEEKQWCGQGCVGNK